MSGPGDGTPAQGAVYDALAQKAAAELHGGAAPRSRLERLESVVVGGLAFLALALCSYNVFVRWFHPPLTLELSDEVQVYLVIWAVFLALGLVTAADRHVKADLFVSLFPRPVQRGLVVFGEVLGFLFALLLTGCGIAIAWDSYSFGDLSTTSLRFPLWIYVSALPVGALVMALAYAKRLLDLRRSAAR